MTPLRAATLSACLIAGSHATAAPSLDEAREKLQATFTNIPVVGFREAPIPGLYELDMGRNIIYFHPEKELLFMGEILTKDGVSLTAQSLEKAIERVTATLPMETGITFGDPDGIKVIEFTDPDCPYCRKYDQWLDTQTSQYKVSRTVYFDTRIHPRAKAKAAHVVCSENKAEAFRAVYRGQIRSDALINCPEAERILDQHQMISERIGISGTPSFLLAGKLQVGFQPAVLQRYLEDQTQSKGVTQ